MAVGWRVAWARRAGRWVAVRVGGLRLRDGDARRYAVFADDPDELADRLARQWLIDVSMRRKETPNMSQHTGCHISSWSSAYVPTGTPVRYLLDPSADADGDPGIRLLLGDADQIEITMTSGTAADITARLGDAVREIAGNPARTGGRELGGRELGGRS